MPSSVSELCIFPSSQSCCIIVVKTVNGSIWDSSSYCLNGNINQMIMDNQALHKAGGRHLEARREYRHALKPIAQMHSFFSKHNPKPTNAYWTRMSFNTLFPAYIIAQSILVCYHCNVMAIRWLPSSAWCKIWNWYIISFAATYMWLYWLDPLVSVMRRLAFHIQAMKVFFLTAKAGSGRAGRKPVLEGSSMLAFLCVLSSQELTASAGARSCHSPGAGNSLFSLFNFLGLLPSQGTSLGDAESSTKLWLCPERGIWSVLRNIPLNGIVLW